MAEPMHPVLSCADAFAWEQKQLGEDEARAWEAMSNAGRALGAAVLRDAEETGGFAGAGQVLVLCGPGHNGGDALIALRVVLNERPDFTACVFVVPGFAALRPLVRRALHELWASAGERVSYRCVSGAADGTDSAWVQNWLDRQSFDLCLDGLYGMRFTPPFRPPGDWLIAAINQHPAIRLRVAVDLPSGMGDASVAQPFRADFSYATGIAKWPLFEPANRPSVGRVRYLDIGFFAGEQPEADLRLITSDVLAPLRRLREASVDKRTFGHVFVIGGSRGMPGAALLAVESALLSGVGLVTAFVPESLAPGFAARLPEAMWVPMPETLEGGLALEGRGSVIARAARCTGLLAGPGLGRERETLALVGELIKAIDVPVVLDADALQPEVVAARGSAGESPLVLTPHHGEFQRVAETKEVSDEILLEAAQRLRAVLALKGAPTRVCDGTTVALSPFGGPVLARGGSGDVLAGLIAGQLAQGTDAFAAAARGVVWHGLAADRLARRNGQTSNRVSRLCDHLGPVLQEATRG